MSDNVLELVAAVVAVITALAGFYVKLQADLTTLAEKLHGRATREAERRATEDESQAVRLGRLEVLIGVTSTGHHTGNGLLARVRDTERHCAARRPRGDPD